MECKIGGKKGVQTIKWYVSHKEEGWIGVNTYQIPEQDLIYEIPMWQSI